MPLSPPPLDELGNTVPHDHLEITGEDGIIRRISTLFVVPDPKVEGGRKISTVAFSPSSPEYGAGLSVDLERSIIEAGIDPQVHVTTPRWIASVWLRAADFRSLGLMVGYSPIEGSADEEPNPHHGEVWGIKTKPQKRSLLKLCSWYVPLPQCALGDD